MPKLIKLIPKGLIQQSCPEPIKLKKRRLAADSPNLGVIQRSSTSS
ncbi:hypothetical protein SynBIOSE41_04073 [Synechococcus sp. BIOS-E4-1]|nr:hypothetical protein SynBIOSE41_04073 [Synechococcus sp. BIOS-E4-1]